MLCLSAQMKKSKPIGLDFLAAELGIEPRQTDSETVVLPLHNSAIFCCNAMERVLLYPIFSVCQGLFQRFIIYFSKKIIRGITPPDGEWNAAYFRLFSS